MYDGVPTTAPSAVSPRARDLDGARFVARVGAQVLGEPPVDDHSLAKRAHQDVVRLEVAVHDQVLVRVAHGGAHLQEQLHALARGQAT